MNRLKFFTAVLCMLTALTASGLFAEAMMLEYDGKVCNYDGAVYDLVVNNKLVESALEPIVFNDRALVPVREVFEEVGAKVNYDGNTKTIEVVDGSDYIRMQINDNVAYVNGVKTAIPDSVVPKLISKVGGETKTMVPVRFISETIGLDVEFDGENGAILVESNGYVAATPVPTAVPTPIPTAVPTLQPTAAPAPEVITIKDIRYQNVVEGKVAITVEMDKEASYSYFTLDNPDRLVVDIQNTKPVSGEETMYVNNGGIKAVRVGVNPERTRVVVDMDKMSNYGFGKEGTNLIIYAKAEVSKPVGITSLIPELSISASADVVAPPVQEVVKYNKNLIVIDAGHGGYDPGAQGTMNGQTINESDLKLQISNKVKSILEGNGFTVVMTRSDDTYKTLIERPELANEKEAAIFVSIHINSVDGAPTANGTEVFYAESNNKDVGGVTSAMLARNILNSMLAHMGSTNRGVKTAEHAVTKRSNMPACLAEVGFITNAEEIAKMTSEDYQWKVAEGIAQGIIQTVNQMQ